MTKFIELIPWLALAAISSPFASAAPAPEPTDQPKVEIVGSGWSADHQLVIGVKVTAPKSRSLPLGKDPDDPESGVTLFTTKESWLIDLASGQKIPASRRFPNQPNFGWIKTVATLAPKDSETFTAAFPAPPLPPLVNGKRPDYLLELHLPGNLPPVGFKVPVPENAATTP